jgi:enoyl-CoA hydratase
MAFEVTRSDGVAEVCMAHPPVNAFEPAQLEELGTLIRELDTEPSLRVLVLRSTTRGFCAGIDIKELADNPGAISSVNRAAFAAFEAIHRSRMPVVAAVHGYALGAGLAIVGACDVVFAAAGTRFGLPEINVGMLGGAAHALRLLPLHKVRAMYFTGEPVDASEMYRLGAVERVVDLEDLRPVTMDFARTVARKGPLGLRFAKESMNGIEASDLERQYRLEQGFTFELSHLPEGLESRRAFMEGRPPDYDSL